MAIGQRPDGGSAQGGGNGAPSYEQLAQAVLDHYRVRPTQRELRLAHPRIRAHALEYGHGVPTLFLHGGDGEAWNFAALMAELGGDLHMYAIDRPSFGASDRFDYRRLRSLRRHAADFTESAMDALGLESALVVGASFGAIYAYALAVAHPERIRALILPGYPAGLVRRAPWRTRLRVAFPSLAAGMVEAGRTGDGQRALHEGAFGVGSGQLPEIYYEARAAGARLPGSEEAWRRQRQMQLGLLGTRRDAYFGRDLRALDRPILQLWGENEANPLAWGRREIERLPNCRFVLMPGVGHFPYLQAPAETARLIREFLADHPEIAAPGAGR